MELSIRDPKKIDFFKKRADKELALKNAQERLAEHKSRSVNSIFPSEIYESPKLMYSCEYIRLLEDVIKAKTSLEVMDMVLEGLMRERIAILEELASA